MTDAFHRVDKELQQAFKLIEEKNVQIDRLERVLFEATGDPKWKRWDTTLL